MFTHSNLSLKFFIRILYTLFSIFILNLFFGNKISGIELVQSDVVNSCRIVSIDPFNFGESFNTTQVFNGFNQLNRNIILRCTKNLNGWITLSEGSNSAPDSNCDVPDRRLKDPQGSYLSYTVSFNNQSINIWGCSVSGADHFISISSNQNIQIQAIALIVQGQDVPPGYYIDQLVLTVNF